MNYYIRSLCSLMFFLICTIFYLGTSKNVYSATLVNDVTRLTPAYVHRVDYPKTVQDVQAIVINAAQQGLKVSVCGTRYSQGGHISYPNGIVIDLRKLNKITAIDVVNKELTVQTGATWEEIQRGIDGLGLALKAMQSYHDFSVGGSLSVNAHGQDIKKPMVISCVKKIVMVMPDGSLKTCSREENSNLFSAALGGYGLIGIMVEVVLELTENSVLEKKTKRLKTSEYPAYFEKNIHGKNNVQLHSARLSMSPLSYLEDVLSITYFDATQEAIDVALKKQGNATRDKIAFFLLKKTYTANILRPFLEENIIEQNEIITRNNAMGSTIAGISEYNSSDVNVLQEYFIPLDRYQECIKIFKKVLPDYRANVLNITIRYVPKNTESMLTYAPQDSFAFVLFINHKRTSTALENMRKMTRELINEINSIGGTYYLPYQLYATKEQLNTIYPRFKEFLSLKKNVDPEERFVNHFYMHYKDTL
ncbi:MAG: FAD-binding protein [Candidatus Babeliales bacterium]